MLVLGKGAWMKSEDWHMIFIYYMGPPGRVTIEDHGVVRSFNRVYNSQHIDGFTAQSSHWDSASIISVCLAGFIIW